MNDPQNSSLEAQLEEKIQVWVAENEELYEDYFTINIGEYRNNSFMLILNDTNIIKITLVDMATNNIALETKSQDQEFKSFVAKCQSQIDKSTPADIGAMMKLVCDQYKYTFMNTAGGENDRFEDPKPLNLVEAIQEFEEEKLFYHYEQDINNLFGSPKNEIFTQNLRKFDYEIQQFTRNVNKDRRASQIQCQRLMKEYQNLICSPEFANYIKITYPESNMRQWNIEFDLTNWVGMPARLASQFETLKFIKGLAASKRLLTYEVIFPEDYPFVPPKICMTWPTVKHGTGFVLMGGALCLESLTEKGWCMRRSLENLFVEIIFLLGEGNAEFKDEQRPFNTKDAFEIFDITALQLGWTVKNLTAK